MHDLLLHPLSSQGFYFLAKHEFGCKKKKKIKKKKRSHFVVAYLCQRVSGTQAIFMCEWINSEIFMHYGLTFGQFLCTFTEVFMPYWKLSSQRL